MLFVLFCFPLLPVLQNKVCFYIQVLLFMRNELLKIEFLDEVYASFLS